MAADISLAQLTYFIHAADTGSMSAAADELYVAQSAVSSAIGQLERRLGVTLFLRQRGKGLRLTAEGEALLVRARDISASVADAVNAVRPDSVTGTLRAACFGILAPFYLPTIAAGLRERSPGLRLEVSEHTVPRVLEALRTREIEIALTYDLVHDPDVDFEPLASFPLYACVASTSTLAGRQSITLEELATHPMILLNLPASREYFLDAFLSLDLNPHIHFEFESFETVRAMVASGHGFALLAQGPERTDAHMGGQVSSVRISDDTRPTTLVLATERGRAPSFKARAFADECRRIFASSA